MGRGASTFEGEVAGLLPAGAGVLGAAPSKLAAGFRTFKWKIGVGPVQEEIGLCRELLEALGPESKLRLDANGGLHVEDLEVWLNALVPHASQIEFIEQPLRVGEEQMMSELAAASEIPIALDESLNGPDGLRWFEPGAWEGPLVIKPLLMGDVVELAERLRPSAHRLVFSSVFESVFGLGNALSLMEILPRSPFALGFDTLRAFDDGLSVSGEGSKICAAEISELNLDELWNRLPHLS